MALRDDSERRVRGRLPWGFREVAPNERVVSSQTYEACPDTEAIVTNTFTEKDGGATLRILVQHPSQETRYAHIASGMEAGMQEAMNHLEHVALSLRQAGYGPAISRFGIRDRPCQLTHRWR